MDKIAACRLIMKPLGQVQKKGRSELETGLATIISSQSTDLAELNPKGLVQKAGLRDTVKPYILAAI